MAFELVEYQAKNYKGFFDTGWVKIKPLTLFFGHNSSGKSALISILPMLKQTLTDSNSKTPFVFSSDNGVDIGNFEEVSHNHIINFDHPIWFNYILEYNDVERIGNRFDFASKNLFKMFKEYNLSSNRIKTEIAVNYNMKQRQIAITNLIISVEDKVLFNIIKKTTAVNQPWHVESDVLKSPKFQLNWEHFIPRINDLDIVDSRDGEFLFNFNYGIAYAMNNALQDLIHIGPLRDFPKRAYRLTGESPNDVGSRGENWLNIFTKAANPKELSVHVNYWLERLGYSLRIEWGKQGFAHVMLKDLNGLEINLKDVGFGISQILPVLIQGFSCNPNTILILEQPEIHLHPKAQAELGDMLIAIANRGVRLLIETHSEHILLRIQRRIAENTVERNMNINSEDIGLYFITYENSRSNISKIDLKPNGEYLAPPKEFRDFFSDDFFETVNWNNSKSKIMGM